MSHNERTRRARSLPQPAVFRGGGHLLRPGGGAGWPACPERSEGDAAVKEQGLTERSEPRWEAAATG